MSTGNARRRSTLAEAHPELAAQWHPTLNGGFRPEDFSRASDEKVWWICDLGHVWEARISNRSRNGGRGTGCPFHAGQRFVVGLNDLASQNPELAAQWHPTRNGDLTPADVGISDKKRHVWWICDLGHEWQAIVASRHHLRSGCPTHTGRKVLTDYNDLGTVRPDLAAEWHPTLNGDLTAKEVTRGQRLKVWWLCATCGHEWEASLRSRSSGRGCWECYVPPSSRDEVILAFELAHFTTVERQVKVRLGDKTYRPDICLPDLAVYVEFDGSWWHAEEGSLAKDQRKTSALESTGWLVVRVRADPLPKSRDEDLVGWGGEYKKTADVVLRHLAAIGKLDYEAVADYVHRGSLLNLAAAEQELDRLRAVISSES